MRFSLTEEQLMLGESVGGWLAERVPPELVRSWFETREHTEFDKMLAAAGWKAVGIPEASGGHGGGLVELAVMAEKLGFGAVPASGWLSTSAVLPLLGAEEVTTSVIEEGAVVAVAVDASRPPAASAFTYPAGRVTGETPMALAAGLARWLVVPVDQTGQVVLVDTGQEGVEVTPLTPLDHNCSLGSVTLNGVIARPLEVDAGDLLAGLRDRLAVLIAADSVGAADRVLAMTVDYAKARKQFGVPIGSFQAVKHAAAQMLVGIEPLRSLVYYAAASCEAGDPRGPIAAAVAKAQAAGIGVAIADSGLTLHGAIGFTWEHDLQFLYKRLKGTAHLYGGASAWNEMVASRLDIGGDVSDDALRSEALF